MDMHQVRYFLALRDELHFTRAAKCCGVAQPSLTIAIKTLERELGGPLFHRERGNIRLSELGQAIAPFLENLNWCAQAAKRKAADFKASQHGRNGGAAAQMGISPRNHRDRSRELGLPGQDRAGKPETSAPHHRRQLASGSGDQGPGLKSAAAKEKAKPARRPKPRGRGTSPATASAVRTGTDYLPR
jgi:hypothetical protein